MVENLGFLLLLDLELFYVHIIQFDKNITRKMKKIDIYHKKTVCIK